MKTRNDFNKYGLTTMIGWNILLIVLILIVSTIKGFPFTYISDDDKGHSYYNNLGNCFSI